MDSIACRLKKEPRPFDPVKGFDWRVPPSSGRDRKSLFTDFVYLNITKCRLSDNMFVKDSLGFGSSWLTQRSCGQRELGSR